MSSEGKPIAVSEGVMLRPIDQSDMKLLRQWKNANRERFFHRHEISAVQQGEWYVAFRDRPDDYMFIVESNGIRFGCMGYRIDGEYIDFYNVIRGRTDIGAGLMHLAFLKLVAEACIQYPGRQCRVLVLADNPAIFWYRKCGFVETSSEGDHVVMFRGNAGRQLDQMPHQAIRQTR